jgi:hypothetical protein
MEYQQTFLFFFWGDAMTGSCVLSAAFSLPIRSGINLTGYISCKAFGSLFFPICITLVSKAGRPTI